MIYISVDMSVSLLRFVTFISFSFLPNVYTGGLFQVVIMLDKSICHFTCVGSVLSFFSVFDGKTC